jgi:NDP-sugar pyrophosphorylase family protein
MMAIILAGGKGARLRPYTLTIPKPLLPIGDMPILEVLLHQLAGVGYTRVVITLGHMMHLFAPIIGDGSRFNLEVTYCSEDKPLGTAGSIRVIDDLEENFLVMNGDLLTTIDYKELTRTHEQANAWGTIAVHKRNIDIDYGVVESTEDGRLDAYIEKPSYPFYVSMGINILSRRCLDFIPQSEKLDMPDLMLAMKKAGHKVMCHRTDCYWQDIGRFDDYEKASEDFTKDSTRFLPERPSRCRKF